MHKRIGKITSTTLGFNDRGAFVALIDVEHGYEGGLCRSIGGDYLGGSFYVQGIQTVHPTKSASDFIMHVLRACAAKRWDDLRGRTIFVLEESEDYNSPVLGIENLPTEPGEQFLFAEWKARAEYEFKIEKALLDGKDCLVQRIDSERWLPGWER